MIKIDIVACIITYNPDIERLKSNLSSLCNQLNYIIIIDNDSKNFSEIEILVDSIIKNDNNLELKIIKNNKNKGIAFALNKGIDYASENNFQWLLTLDQDSVINYNLLEEYRSALNNMKEVNIGMLTCEVVDENIKQNIEDINFKIIKNKYTESDCAITSGTLLNIDASIKVNKFIENLFIDYVDFEMSLRLKKNGFKIIKVNSTNIFHNLGEIKEHNILKYKFITTNHSPIRRYYMYRNKIYVYKNYYKKFPKWVILDLFSSIKTLILIMIFEDNKIEKIKNILKGIYDGILNKYSVV